MLVGFCRLPDIAQGGEGEQLTQGAQLAASSSNFIDRHFDSDNVTNMSLLSRNASYFAKVSF